MVTAAPARWRARAGAGDSWTSLVPGLNAMPHTVTRAPWAGRSPRARMMRSTSTSMRDSLILSVVSGRAAARRAEAVKVVRVRTSLGEAAVAVADAEPHVAAAAADSGGGPMISTIWGMPPPAARHMSAAAFVREMVRPR